MENTKKVLSATILQFGSRIYLILLSLVGILFLARSLTVAQFGSYSLLTSIIGILSTVADSGLNTMAMKSLSQRHDRTEFNYFFSLKTLILFGFVLIALIVAWVAPESTELRYGFSLYVLTLLFNGLASILLLPMQSKLIYLPNVILDVVSRTLLTGFYILLFFALRSQPHLLLIVFAVSAALSLLNLGICYVMVRSKSFLPAFQIHLPTFYAIVRTALPLTIITILGVINYRVDILVLAFLKGNEAVGTYSLAYRFIDVILPFSSLFIATAFPILVRNSLSMTRTTERLNITFNKAARFLLLLSIPVASIATVMSRELVLIVGGARYLVAAQTLVVLLLSIPVTFVTMLAVQTLIAEGHQKQLLKISIFGVVLNIVLNFSLDTVYSYLGAATSTLVSEIIGGAIIFVIMYRLIRIHLDMRMVTQMVGIGVVTAATTYLFVRISHNFFIESAVGGVVYLGLVLSFKLVDIQELKEIRRAESGQGS